MRWLLLLPLLLVACAPASDVRELREQVGFLQAQVRDLQDKVKAADTRDCLTLYITWTAAVKQGWAQDRRVDDALPGCPTWEELKDK